MAIKIKKTVLLAKIEATYGTDPTPTAAANAILARNITITPMEGDLVERNIVRGFFGNAGSLVATKYATIEFEVELAGSGAAGTAPGYGVLLRACCLSETVTASTKVEYSPITTGEESATLYFYIDGVLHKLLGARGTVGVRMTARQIPVFAFKLIGLYSAVTDAALPAPTLTSYQKPLPVNKTNTPTFTIHSYAAKVQELSIDLGNVYNYRHLVGQEEVAFTDRNTIGSLTVDAVTVATKDFFGIAAAETTGALAVVHGTTAGNKVQIDAATGQITKPTYQDGDGVALLQMGLILQPTSAGNDEIKFTIL